MITARLILGLILFVLGWVFGVIAELLFALFDHLEDWCYRAEAKLNKEP